MIYTYMLMETGKATVHGDYTHTDPERVRSVGESHREGAQRVVLVERHTPDWEAIERTCPNCGNDLSDASCKLVCSDCGYFKSCAEF